VQSYQNRGRRIFNNQISDILWVEEGGKRKARLLGHVATAHYIRKVLRRNPEKME